MNDFEALDLPWDDDGTLSVYLDPEDGHVCIEIDDFDRAINFSPAEWVQVTEFIAAQRLRRCS